MEVDRLQPFFNIETRTGLLDPWEVSVTENLGFGIVGAEALEKLDHGLLLGWSASVGWVAVGSGGRAMNYYKVYSSHIT